MRIAIGLLAALALLGAAGCGGKSAAEKQAEAAAAAASGRGTITCDGSALSGASGLPGDFPVLDGVTYVTSKKNGPTTVVDGFTSESLAGMHIEWRDRFLEAGYTVPFHEIEQDRGDSEVAYKTKKGSGQTEGIVALRGGDACANGNVSIHITNRPSG